MAYDGSITLYTDVDTKGLKSGMNTIQNGAKSLTAAIGKLGAAIGIAFSIGALIKFGKEAVSLASDIEEVQNVVDVAFGDMAYKMEEFADNAIEMYGISKLAAKEIASTYMSMAAGMGMSLDTAGDMSLALTGLAADLASFRNKSVEETKTALASVFTGETETLKNYGIVMTEVNLQEYARQQGITKSITAMTQQEKVMLRYNYVMEQTKLAQGDAVRTYDSWANATKRLTYRWQEMQARFGEAFKAIVTLILPAIESLIAGLTKVAELAKQAAVHIAAMFGKEIDTSSGVSDNIEQSVSNQNALTDAVKETEKAQKGMLAGFDEINILSKETASTNSDNAALNMPTASDYDIEEPKIKLKDIKIDWGEFGKSLSDGLLTALRSLRTVISEFDWESLGTAIGEAINNIELDKIIVEWFGLVGDVTGTLMDILIGLIEEIDWGKLASDLWNGLVGVITETDWGGLVSRAFRLLGAAIGAAGSFMITLAKEIWNSLKEAFESTKNYFSKYIDEAGGNVIKGLLNGIWNGMKNIGIWIKEHIFQPFIDGFKNAFGIHSPSKEMENMGSFIVSGFMNGITSLPEKAKELFTKVLNTIKKVFGNIGDWFKNIFSEAWQKVKDVFSPKKMFSGISNGISKAAGWAGDLLGKNREFSMPINTPMIPKLAQGAVIPGGKPFIAMLGDQKAGQTNIEAPLDTIVEAFRQVQSNTPVTIRFEGSLSALGRVLKPVIDTTNNRASVW